ncbi:Crp/Fnr family transcriptional regulator [Sphingomonas floccifaciens]|uniref:Crp/Fnr family transcriptional regulator n=1 Tax=Sphingomonas floccifaciens TaxID=1844115 RepID=A0ABW4NHU0_9SPHN
MPQLLARKYEQFIGLADDDRAALQHLADSPARTARARTDIIREGEQPRGAMLILDGWASLYKTLEDGRRQMLAMLLPGDLCELNASMLREMDHSLGTITALTYVELPAPVMEALAIDHPRIASALTWDLLVAAAIQREWTLNLGQRSALERIAHLICEMFVRLNAVGLTQAGGFDCPLTQTDLAEATGMTPVHVNRTLQDLRARRLIEWRGRSVVILRWQDLCSAAMFSPNYLHIERSEDHPGVGGQQSMERST